MLIEMLKQNELLIHMSIDKRLLTEMLLRKIVN